MNHSGLALSRIFIPKGIRTDAIDDLFHRKLRTITGMGEVITGAGRVAGKGARQADRESFDLYVLSKEIRPIIECVAEINSSGYWSRRFFVRLIRVRGDLK